MLGVSVYMMNVCMALSSFVLFPWELLMSLIFIITHYQKKQNTRKWCWAGCTRISARTARRSPT